MRWCVEKGRYELGGCMGDFMMQYSETYNFGGAMVG